ncbi:MAG: hypothetical protein AAF985_18955, partial [Bacteroidota bacterium]
KKKKRKKSKGKELGINYRILHHNVIELKDGYLFVGEVYFPKYRSEANPSYSMKRGGSPSNKVFDGYQYTHGVIAKFSNEGALLWDRNFDLYQTDRVYYLKRFIRVSGLDDRGVKIAYAFNNRIVSKYISYNGDILLDTASEEIETGFDGDQIKWSFSNLSYWYDDYFLVQGEQKIKNKKDKSAKRKRRVLFLNKVKY